MFRLQIQFADSVKRFNPKKKNPNWVLSDLQKPHTGDHIHNEPSQANA